MSSLLLGCENTAEPRIPHRAVVVTELRTVVLGELRDAVRDGASSLFVIRLRAAGPALRTGCLEDVRHGFVCLSSVR